MRRRHLEGARDNKVYHIIEARVGVARKAPRALVEIGYRADRFDWLCPRPRPLYFAANDHLGFGKILIDRSEFEFLIVGAIGWSTLRMKDCVPCGVDRFLWIRVWRQQIILDFD